MIANKSYRLYRTYSGLIPAFTGVVFLHPAALILLLVSSAQAVGIRVATFNIGAHLVIPADGGNVYFDFGIGPPGTPDHDQVRAVLQRINADVVALQEIHTADITSGNLNTLASGLGYLYVYAAPTTNAFDTSLRVVFISKFPFLTTTAIGSPAGFREITRLIPAVKVDVPGTTQDPLLISAHLKSGTATADRFRRAVEMKRLSSYLTAQAVTASDNFIILGDFNPSSRNTTFSSQPSGLPNTFLLGPGISYPFSYTTNMLAYFSNPVPVKLDPRHLNNSPSTFGTTNTSGSVLDSILVSPAIAGRPHCSEIYNSNLDLSNSVGLPKAGSPPAANTSSIASDHYAVFADLELDQNFSNLTASVSAATVAEGSAAGTVNLDITLPASLVTDLTLTLTSDDPAAATLTSGTYVVPAGTTTVSLPIVTPRNFITDGTRSVVFTASAPSHTPATAVLEVTDADPPYTFTAVGQTITESFTGFSGTQNPAPWATAGEAWRGSDNGSGTNFGFRSYGTAGDASLGFLAGNSPGTATTGFVNSTSKLLTAVEISFTAEQWRAVHAGRPDSLQVELITEAGSQFIPNLSFSAATDLPTGPLPDSASTTKSAIVTGLSIPPGDQFDLRFTFTPAGILPSDIFLNELHYDNIGSDTNEFIEIIVGPGFVGQLTDIDVFLYNGDSANNAVVYNTLNLATSFTPGANFGAYRIFTVTLPANGLQNGPRDGFAIVNQATSQVLHLLSYGGTFTAGTGPAAGMTSTAIPVSQSNSTTVAGSAIGLTGTGSIRQDFISWAATFGSHSKGLPNAGQILTPVPLPQGIAMDNLSVTFLPDNDLDGIPDLLDPDDDNDSQTDLAEVLFGTDPLNAASFYQLSITRSSATTMTLSFTTLTGRRYTIESSIDLIAWTPVSVQSGTGSNISIFFDRTESAPRVFYRLAVTAE